LKILFTLTGRRFENGHTSKKLSIMKLEKQDRIEQIISAWDGAKKAEAPAFFYARLKARMEREAGEQTIKSWLLKPAFVIATLVAVIIINAFIFFQNGNTAITPSSGDETIQTIAAEYNISDNILEEINQ
jgi:hypothetical protein